LRKTHNKNRKPFGLRFFEEVHKSAVIFGSSYGGNFACCNDSRNSSCNSGGIRK